MSNVKPNDGEDVLSLLDSLGDSAQPPTTAAPTNDRTSTENEKELLGFLDDLAKPSRSQTPRPRTSRDTPRAAATAATAATKKSIVEKPAEKARVEKPVAQEESKQQTETASGGGGWLGGLWNMGSAAMKTAELKVKELQQTEEAKVWEEKLRGNVSVLGKLGKVPLLLLFITWNGQ